MQSKRKGISVVIPNYNGRQLLSKNLPFVYAALKASGCAYEIIIPDDASTDKSVEFIKQHYPDVILVENTANGGFSVNINRGIRKATLDLVLLLNSDIALDADYFASQLKYFEQSDTFGVMGSVVDQATGQLAEACKYPLPSVFKINHFKNIAIAGNHIYTLYLSGANALVDRDKLVQLGGFNEIYSPFYHEDLDLCLRAWESGWKCYHDNDAVCKHAVSTTIKSHSSQRKIKTISTRNRLLLHAFHLDGMRLYLWHLVTFLSLLVKWLTFRMYFYSAYVDFLKKLPQMQAYKRNFGKAVSAHPLIPYTVVKQKIKAALDPFIK